MHITWSEDGWDEYLWWQTQDKKTVKRINGLIRDMQRTPFEGLGKPVPRKGAMRGWWSRRIDDENRIVYRVSSGALVIASCKTHYGEK